MWLRVFVALICLYSLWLKKSCTWREKAEIFIFRYGDGL
ncbi:Uncharacterized protein dnm_055150 [Desulfonema magnum]|uniref:Uncharacterized protein n=1 Tax=Desulfonema magnum TaxID=45655 RepID=A0A975BPT2_9BACT|nr:Uncharacterized protein dnm_055150 [Desulfonema magnum]